MAIQRLGPKAIPAIRDALKNTSSDETRRRLISTLAGMGAEGQAALQELLKNGPALGLCAVHRKKTPQSIRGRRKTGATAGKRQCDPPRAQREARDDASFRCSPAIESP